MKSAKASFTTAIFLILMNRVLSLDQNKKQVREKQNIHKSGARPYKKNIQIFISILPIFSIHLPKELMLQCLTKTTRVDFTHYFYSKWNLSLILFF